MLFKCNIAEPLNKIRGEKFPWRVLTLFTLGFWLSGSLIIDLLVIPSLSAMGMMSDKGFASIGYVLFENFNHLELICGALVLTGFLSLAQNNYNQKKANLTTPKNNQFTYPSVLILSGVLLTIAIIYTYFLTPQMSGLSLELNWFNPSVVKMSGDMLSMQISYWLLEAVKLITGCLLLQWVYGKTLPQERNIANLNES